MRRKRLRTLCIALLLMGTTVSVLRAQGRLEIVGGNIHDWGVVDPGALKADIELKNAGTGDLSILEIRRTCLCTVPTMPDKTVLKPGEQAVLGIQLDVASQKGVVIRRVLIRTIDSTLGSTAREDTTWLELRATVKRDIQVEPALSVIAGGGKVGQEVRALPLRISNQSDAPVTLSSPMLEDGATVTARFEFFRGREKINGDVVVQPNEHVELRSYVTPLIGGQMAGRVILQTSNGKIPIITLGVVGTVAEPASAAGGGKASK